MGTGPGASPTASKLPATKGRGDRPTGPTPTGSWHWQVGWQQGPLHSLWDPRVGRLQGMQSGEEKTWTSPREAPHLYHPPGSGRSQCKGPGVEPDSRQEAGAWLAGGTVARDGGRGGQGWITRGLWPLPGRVHIVP